jgi:proteasome accessory factor C
MPRPVRDAVPRGPRGYTLTMPSHQRVTKLQSLLDGARTPLSTDSLCGSLGVSRATVKRLISYLRDEARLPVRFDREGGGYLLDRSADLTTPREGASFTAQELSALLTANEILEQIPPGTFRRETARMRAHLQRLLFQRPTGARQLRARIRLSLPQNRRVDESVFAAVLGALQAQRRLRVSYRSRSREADTERDLSPARLTFYRSNWYLAAWCHRSDDLRVFSLDRIAQAQRLPTAALQVPDVLLEKRLSSGYGIFEGEADQTAVLRFSPDSARWVADEPWHPRQRSQRQPDGSLIIEVPFRHAVELQMDILRYGDGVEVLGPPMLREQVGKELRAAARRYRGDGGVSAGTRRRTPGSRARRPR